MFVTHMQASNESTHAKERQASSMFRRSWTLIVLLLMTFGMAQNAMAGVTASILGTVKDSTGAVIPGARVTATNVDTHVSQTVLTNGDGAYVFPALQTGNYEISVSITGFKSFKQTGIVLNVNDALTIDTPLQ